MLSHKNTRVAISSFYSDINIPDISLNLARVTRKYPHVICMGDSNAHSGLWGSQRNNARGDSWESYIVRNGLYVANNSACDLPTFSNHLGSSNIDVALTNKPERVSEWVNTSTFHGSDHSIILMRGLDATRTDDRTFQNIKNADWTKFVDNLKELPPYNVTSKAQLNERAERVISNIQMAFNSACPPKRSFPGKPCKWWTPALTNLLRKKKLAARLAKRLRGTQRGYRAYLAKKSLGRLFQKRLRSEKSESWKQFTSSLSGYRNIASLFKSLKNVEVKNIPLLKSEEGISMTTRRENLSLLRKTHFRNSTETFSTDKGSTGYSEGDLTSELDDFLTLDLLDKAISTLPNGKAPGPDGIKNELIRKLPNQYRRELLNQFKSSIKLSYIPETWLHIRAIYISKGGSRNPSDPKAYRPIGLSSAILKLCERLVNWRLKDTVLKRGIPKQHAFTLGLSTETALSELVHFLEKAKCNGQFAIVLSIDIQGAFDTVPFDVIRDSLTQHGVEREIVNWIDFLSRNRVITTGDGSEVVSFRPKEGTTQGGLNGPDIWIICLWAIIFTAAATSSKLSKFADDLISALMGRDLRVMRDVIQGCLTELNDWFTSRGLTISAQKSMCMVVNAKKALLPPNLILNGEEIPFVDSFKYLGVKIDNNLTWRPHITNRLSKAKRDLMTAKRLVTNMWGLTPERMAWLYQSIVRPSIDYSCHVWMRPNNVPDWMVRELEKTQRLALTAITACTYTTPSKALERLTNIKPLDLHLKEKAACTVARIYEAVDKSNWDGIGSSDKRSHLFAWNKYLGTNLPPVRKINSYNFGRLYVNLGGDPPPPV